MEGVSGDIVSSVCACGCGLTVKVNYRRPNGPWFIHGHNSRVGKPVKAAHLSAVAKSRGFGKWMLGRKASPETRAKLSASRRGKNTGPLQLGHKIGLATRFVRGQTAWNRGKKGSTPTRAMHWNWKGGLTDENKKERVRFTLHYAPHVLRRDDYVCSNCKKRGEACHVDHIKSWAEFPDLRFDLSNCRTLCWRCHYRRTFGRDPTPETKPFGFWRSHAIKRLDQEPCQQDPTSNRAA